MLVIAAIVFVCSLKAGEVELVLTDLHSGKEYAAFPLGEDGQFSIEFIHSVNQSPVTDVYQVRGQDFYVIETRYYSFGAGVQTQLEKGQTLSYAPDGAMVVSGFNTKMTGMCYLIGMVSDHILSIGGSQYSLRDLCGRGSSVVFTLRK